MLGLIRGKSVGVDILAPTPIDLPLMHDELPCNICDNKLLVLFLIESKFLVALGS